MRAFEHSIIVYMNRKRRLPPRRMKILLAFWTPVFFLCDDFSRKEPRRDKNQGDGNRNRPPRRVVAFSKPMHLAGGEAK